jgi:hypothetical protein
MKRKLLILSMVVTLFGSLFFAGCYQYHDEVYLDELDITLTYYNKDFDFQTYTTFGIRDSVGLYTNYLTEQQQEDFYDAGGASQNIRNYVKQKFIDQGYTFVDNGQQADFYVNLFVAMINNTEVVYYPGGWYGYYPYYEYYYGWYYPYYGYTWYYDVYEYQSGTLLMEIADGASVQAYRQWAETKTPEEIQNADPSEIPMIIFQWQGLVNGVADENAEYNADRAKTGVDEAFAQSPYLTKN